MRKSSFEDSKDPTKKHVYRVKSRSLLNNAMYVPTSEEAEKQTKKANDAVSKMAFDDYRFLYEVEKSFYELIELSEKTGLLRSGVRYKKEMIDKKNKDGLMEIDRT